VDYTRVSDITKELLDMGCYEVSLGDTVGTGNPTSVSQMLETVIAKNPVEKLAVRAFHLIRRVLVVENSRLCIGSRKLNRYVVLLIVDVNALEQFHDTFGMGVANAMAAVSAGVRSLDSSVGGLGGCPYSPGATGNVATEDIMYALKDSPYSFAGDLGAVAETGFWISEKLGRDNASRVGKAIRARKLRAMQDADKAKL